MPHIQLTDDDFRNPTVLGAARVFIDAIADAYRDESSTLSPAAVADVVSGRKTFAEVHSETNAIGDMSHTVAHVVTVYPDPSSPIVDPNTVGFGEAVPPNQSGQQVTAPAVPTAPVPTAPAPTESQQSTAPSPTGSSVELDAEGLPWDARIHSSSKGMNADGRWKARRNLDPAVAAKVKAELLTALAVPAAPAAVAPVPTPPAPVPPAPVVAQAPIPPAPPAPAPTATVPTPPGAPAVPSPATGVNGANPSNFKELMDRLSPYLMPQGGWPARLNSTQLAEAAVEVLGQGNAFANIANHLDKLGLMWEALMRRVPQQ